MFNNFISVINVVNAALCLSVIFEIVFVELRKGEVRPCACFGMP